MEGGRRGFAAGFRLGRLGFFTGPSQPSRIPRASTLPISSQVRQTCLSFSVVVSVTHGAPKARSAQSARSGCGAAEGVGHACDSLCKNGSTRSTRSIRFRTLRSFKSYQSYPLVCHVHTFVPSGRQGYSRTECGRKGGACSLRSHARTLALRSRIHSQLGARLSSLRSQLTPRSARSRRPNSQLPPRFARRELR